MAELLSPLLKIFAGGTTARSGRFRRRYTSFTALDIEGSLLRAVQSTRRRSLGHLSRFAVKELRFPEGANNSDPAVIGAAVVEALKELRIAPGPLVMGLPRAVVLLRSLAFPATEDMGELAAMVHFQFGKELPFAAEDAIIDFKIQSRTGEANAERLATSQPNDGPGSTPPAAAGEKIEVLAAAVRKEVVEQYRAIAAAARLELTSLGMLSYAHARGLSACRIAESGQPVALVALRADEMTIDILCDGSLVFSRTANLKPSHTEPAPESAASPKSDEAPASPPPPDNPSSPEEEFTRAVTIEVVRTLHSYEGVARDNHVEKVVVVGATGFESGTVQALQSRFNLPCVLLEPAAALNLEGAQPKDAAGALGVIGLALSAADAQGLPFDFLNPKRPPVPRNTRPLKIAAAAAAALVLLGTALGVRQHLIHKRLDKKAAIEKQLTAEQKHQNLFRLTRLQARIIQDWLKENQSWLDHYAYLSMILPPNTELYVSSLSVSSRGAVQLAVQARAGETLAGLDKTLRSAGYDVKPLAITPAADRFGYPFKSTIELTVPPGKKIDFDKILGPSNPGGSSTNAPALAPATAAQKNLDSSTAAERSRRSP